MHPGPILRSTLNDVHNFPANLLRLSRFDRVTHHVFDPVCGIEPRASAHIFHRPREEGVLYNRKCKLGSIEAMAGRIFGPN